MIEGLRALIFLERRIGMATDYIVPKTRAGMVAGSRGNFAELANDPADSSLLVRQGGKYSQAALGGRMFGVSNQAAVAVTAAYAATFTGLAVGNPATSGVNCKLINMSFSNTVVGGSVGSI